jgi:hypothetical protein
MSIFDNLKSPSEAAKEAEQQLCQMIRQRCIEIVELSRLLGNVGGGYPGSMAVKILDEELKNASMKGI